jgi:hypothetical protein
MRQALGGALRLPLRDNAPQEQRAQTTSLPAPVGGWNARDSIAAMPPLDAVIMDNWFPDTDYVKLRNGYTNHVTGISGQVETLMQYSSGTARKMFAAAGTSIYDASAAGAVGAAVVTAQTNARWQFANFGTSGGQFLIICNGADTPQNYNGTTWQTTPAITGVTSANLIHVNVFKTRLFFIEKNTLKAWYLPVASIGGAASALDFSNLCRLGGSLTAMTTWSLDGGNGLDDYAVWITSEGEVIVYRGTDPSSAANWALVGVFRMGRPIGRRCFFKIGADVVFITTDGFVLLSKALLSDRAQPQVALSDKISNAANLATNTYRDNFGWQPILYPKGKMGIFNVPAQESSVAYQYVMNIQTGAWCRFTGWNANCWELFDEAIYFGTAGAVCKADNGSSDNNTIISADVKQAYNYFSAPGRLKRFTMARPIILSDGIPGLALIMNVDFEDSLPLSEPAFTGGGGSPWNTSPWDTSPWAGTLRPSRVWQSLFSVGYAGSFRMKSATKNITMQWAATDIAMEYGGVI